MLGGFATMAILVMITTAIAAAALVPGGMRAMTGATVSLPRAYLTANLIASAVAAFAGGAVTARLAPDRPLYHGIALAILMCLMGLVSMRQAGGRQPRWYQLVLCTVMPAIALIGAYISGQVGGRY
ncbi:MAG TPA: hypothetical protein VG940_07685 [Gemmatimonadales bacterium]|nr:hypothetical protein [Gemmatimonadales bacterium]